GVPVVAGDDAIGEGQSSTVGEAAAVDVYPAAVEDRSVARSRLRTAYRAVLDVGGQVGGLPEQVEAAARMGLVACDEAAVADGEGTRNLDHTAALGARHVAPARADAADTAAGDSHRADLAVAADATACTTRRVALHPA